jgi:hypothetical protein
MTSVPTAWAIGKQHSSHLQAQMSCAVGWSYLGWKVHAHSCSLARSIRVPAQHIPCPQQRPTPKQQIRYTSPVCSLTVCLSSFMIHGRTADEVTPTITGLSGLFVGMKADKQLPGTEICATVARVDIGQRAHPVACALPAMHSVVAGANIAARRRLDLCACYITSALRCVLCGCWHGTNTPTILKLPIL